MRVIIGGSSSSGTSLMNQCLGRHRDVIISQETSIFARPQLFSQWSGQKGRILGNNKLYPLRSYSWHRENGIVVPWDVWKISRADMQSIVQRSSRFYDFISCLEDAILSATQHRLWVEKTPANATAFPFLNHNLDQTVLVLMVRHPLEAIASMIFRGFSVLYACGVYLINTAFGLLPERHFMTIIKYEELIINYELITRDILEKANLSDGQIDWSTNVSNVKMKGWRFAEDELPKQSDHNRFNSLTDEQQEEVLNMISALRIKDGFQILDQGPRLHSMIEIASYLGYTVPEVQINPTLISRFQKEYTRDLCSRSLRLDSINCFNHPFNIGQ